MKILVKLTTNIDARKPIGVLQVQIILSYSRLRFVDLRFRLLRLSVCNDALINLYTSALFYGHVEMVSTDAIYRRPYEFCESMFIHSSRAIWNTLG